MHDNLSVLSKQHRVQQYTSISDVFEIFNLLTSPDLLNKFESLLDEAAMRQKKP